MSSTSIQFFATVEELVTFVCRWLVDEDIFAAAVEYQPFSATPIAPENAEECLRNEQVRRLVFSEQLVDCAASGNNELLDRNNGSLLLDIGRIGLNGMSESCISTTNLTPCWRRIIADVKRSTTAGMVGTNEQSGGAAKYRALRYTKSAAYLAETGTVLRPFAKSPVVLRPDR